MVGIFNDSSLHATSISSSVARRARVGGRELRATAHSPYDEPTRFRGRIAPALVAGVPGLRSYRSPRRKAS